NIICSPPRCDISRLYFLYCLSVFFFFFFFFQAEDGIRDYKVTGVQTCALPICISSLHDQPFETRREAAQQRADAEGGQSQREYPATPVNISQPAGENEKGALAEQISVVDVALSLQGPDDVRGQIPRNPGQRNGQDARVQKDNAGPENRRPQRSTPVGHDRLSPLNCLRLVRRTAISRGREYGAAPNTTEAPGGSAAR